MNYRLTISYDGTRYHGWESKKEVDTIEGKLEAVFARMTEQDVKIHGAGRTDAGVQDRKSTRLNSSHNVASRMPSSA